MLACIPLLLGLNEELGTGGRCRTRDDREGGAEGGIGAVTFTGSEFACLGAGLAARLGAAFILTGAEFRLDVDCALVGDVLRPLVFLLLPKIDSPAIEKEPIKRILVSHTRTATKTVRISAAVRDSALRFRNRCLAMSPTLPTRS